jgi:hypothetical protein
MTWGAPSPERPAYPARRVRLGAVRLRTAVLKVPFWDGP